MAYLIGTDEAGFGPNLGPLIVSATVWRVPDDQQAKCLYEQLSLVVTDKPNDAQNRIAVADSKQLYKPGGGLRHLERGLWAAMAAESRRKAVPTSWQRLWERLSPENVNSIHQIPWYQDYECDLPIDICSGSNDEPEWLSDPMILKFASVLPENAISLERIESAVVVPESFNQGVAACGSKGRLLSEVTLNLVAKLIGQLGPEPITVVCDKHGGRNNYAPLLQEVFGETLVRTEKEGRAASVYWLGTQEQPIQITFRTKGEEFLPAALASMASKYLREIAMRAFNDFWSKHVPGLRPTAGYPMDAKRFRIDVETARQKLHIKDDVFWRCR